MAIPQAAPPLDRPNNGMATAGMVLGILGIVLCWVPGVGLLCALLGIVFGSIGLSRAGRLHRGRGAAVTGLVCGILGFVILPIMAAIAIPAFLDYMNHSKATAADLDARRIEAGIKSYYADTVELPPSAQEMPGSPTDACMSPTGKLPVRSYAEWNADPGWRAIHFTVDEPSRYSYTWTRESPTHGVLVVSADLDCDGTISTRRIEFEAYAGDVTVFRGPPTPE